MIVIESFLGLAEGSYCSGPAASMAARRKEMIERLKMRLSATSCVAAILRKQLTSVFKW